MQCLQLKNFLKHYNYQNVLNGKNYKKCRTHCFHSICTVETMRFFYDNFQNLFQTGDIGLFLASIVSKVCIFVILLSDWQLCKVWLRKIWKKLRHYFRISVRNHRELAGKWSRHLNSLDVIFLLIYSVVVLPCLL